MYSNVILFVRIVSELFIILIMVTLIFRDDNLVSPYIFMKERTNKQYLPSYLVHSSTTFIQFHLKAHWNNSNMIWSAVFALSCLLAYAHGHGRLAQPVGRASLWRTGLYSDVPPNYDDNGLNCGGLHHQHFRNGGRCGICGDAFDSPQPRAHELGGKYGQGHIVATYEQDQIINTKVYISADKRGFWEFRLCVNPSDQTQECFDNFLLELENGGTKYYPRGNGMFDVNYRLPADVVCDHCVLQWKYTAGNNWGTCADGSGALGCGIQENFFSCSDISIKRKDLLSLE